MPRLYDDLASWWPLLSAPEDYEEEAGFYSSVLIEACSRPPRTVLELGCGGGNNALHMKRRFQLTLTDPSSGMLAHSRRLNPECEHIVGDMRTLRLNRQFDAVFVHDAVCYMTSEADLALAMQTAFAHCRPGGAALFCPDVVRETFEAETECGGHDGDRRALRYLEWTWDPDPKDSTYTVDYVYLLRDHEGQVRVEQDRHIEGLFDRATWLRLLADCGFVGASVPFEHSELAPGSHEVFVGRKPEG